MSHYAADIEVGPPVATGRAWPGRQILRACLLFVVAVTTYLSIPLMSGSRLLVPSYPTVALLPLMLLATWSNITTGDIVFMFKVAFVLVISIAFSPGYVHADEKFLSLIQCCMAMTVALAVVRLMHQLRTRVLERALLYLWLFVVIGSILEVAGVIRGVSDAFRQWAYTGAYTIYSGVERDINMVGWLRPKLFSVEPSHVTKLFVASVNAWLLLRVTWAKVWVTVAATLVMLMVMGSPMLLVSAATTFAIILWNRRAHLRTKFVMVLAALAIAILFGTYYEGSRYAVIANRISSIGESTLVPDQDMGSEEQRMVYPYVTLMDTLKRWPFFGVGIGGKEVVFEASGFTVNDADNAIGNNAFAETGVYLGILGTLAFVYVVARGMRHTGIQRLGLMGIMAVLFSQLMGGMVSFRYWGYIALLWGALAVADSREEGDALIVRRIPGEKDDPQPTSRMPGQLPES